MIRTAFATCVQLGLSCIQEVYRLGGRFDLFITLKDDMAAQKSGRIYLDEVASAHGTELLKIRNINDPEVIAALKTHGIDWLFIIGWSQIARQEVLNAPYRYAPDTPAQRARTGGHSVGDPLRSAGNRCDHVPAG